jgi:hypothetical protein
MGGDFRQDLVAFATRMVDVAGKCSNEESTKLFLVLPFLATLGYDDRDPHEVCPEHCADFSEKYKNRVDFAILKNGEPIIAIECKCVGTLLKDDRGQLRAYFNAAKTVKMGILTDGLIYEFYADSDEPNMMDQTAFLTVDLREVARGKIEDSIIEDLGGLRKATFDPENIGAEAKRKLIFQNFVAQLTTLATDPSEAFTRMMLQSAGINHVRAKGLAEYQDLVKAAFRAFINLRILQRLDLPIREPQMPPPTAAPDVTTEPPPVEDRTITTEREFAVLDYIRHRLAYLVSEEKHFLEIKNILYHDYQGKLVVYYRRERKGRLFDFIEGSAPGHLFRFVFADGTDVVGDDLSTMPLDEPLLALFTRRVAEEKGG